MVRSSLVTISTISSWNSIIRQAVNHGDPLKALMLFRQLKQQHSRRPNNSTFPIVAKACGKLSNLKYSQMIHGDIVKSPHNEDVYVKTALVDAYVKCSHLECANNVFEEMSERDVASWNSMIMGFSQVGSLDRVGFLFSNMRIHGFVPDAVTVMGLIQSACGVRDAGSLSSVHCFCLKCGLSEDVSVANTLVSSYARCGDIGAAEMVFDSIDMDFLSVVSWNALIAGFAYFEDSVNTMRLYRRMLCCLYRPDLSTILNLLSSFSQPCFLCCGMMIHAHGVKLGCDADITLLNTLISMYSKCGHVGFGRYVFNCMSVRSCVTWTAMIGGYSEIGDLDEALHLFHEMEASGEKPDVVTVIHLIKSCGKVGALEVGKWADDYAINRGLNNNIMICNALLDMYAKCGSIDNAQILFSRMKAKNVISWTTFITGLALNGKFQAALDYFNQMTKNSMKPNQITFLAVLQACTHAGLLDKGLEIFSKMTKTYQIRPELDHYSCIADLFGRRGKVKEAFEFILEMPIKPDAGIWGSLLSACKIHRNLEIAKYAADRLFELEPHASAPYVEMANVYASANEWKEFADMRMKMKVGQVKKKAGQSVVYVDGTCRSFTVEDRFHREGSQIFETLDTLVSHLKDEIDIFHQDMELPVT